MGRGVRRFHFSGFLADGDVAFAGGPVELQRTLMAAAAETQGPGILTHPTLGILNVAVETFSLAEDLGAGSESDIEFTFVEAGSQLYPSLLVSTGSSVLTAAGLAVVAIASDFVSAFTLAYDAAAEPTPIAASTTAAWSDQVVSTGGDATALLGLASQLPGNWGRYFSGGNSGYVGTFTSPYSSDTTVADLVQDASTQRAAIAAAAASLDASVSTETSASSASVIAAAAQTLVQALLSACADPADAIRLLSGLLGFSPPSPSLISPIGVPINDLFRRTCVIAIAQAAESYQPTSYDDALSQLLAITALMDAEIDYAGDQGDDDTFNAICALRVAVVQDLRARGADLAAITTFEFGAPLPDCVLATRIYRDPSRADQLTETVDPVHPLFFPTIFEALAS
jgi:prophage DNA circulation protein